MSIRDLRAGLDTEEEEIETIRERIQDLASDFRDMSKRIAGLLDLVKDIETDEHDAEEERDRLSERVEELESELGEARERIAGLEAELEAKSE